MAEIRVRRTGKITVDKLTAAKAVAPEIERHQRERVARNLDVNDRPMAEYSSLYKMQLAAIGEDTDVDISRSGELMKSVRLLRTEVRGETVTLIFGADEGTSPRRPRPPPWVFSQKQTPEQRANALERWRRAPKKTMRSPSHRTLLGWIINGNGNSPRRQVLGVSPRGRGSVIAKLERTAIFRS